MSKNRTPSKHADRAYSSSRRHYLVFVQHISGMPKDDCSTVSGSRGPPRVWQRVESSQYATRYLAATALDGATGKGGGGVSPSRRVRRSSDGPHFAQSRELKIGVRL